MFLKKFLSVSSNHPRSIDAPLYLHENASNHFHTYTHNRFMSMNVFHTNTADINVYIIAVVVLMAVDIVVVVYTLFIL